MNHKPTLILASTSAYRRSLLQRLLVDFEVRSPGVEELEVDGETPAARALRLAIAKARAVAREAPQAVVVGSDQVASLATPSGVQILDKPGTQSRSREQLARMSGQELFFDTAVAVIWPTGSAQHIDRTTVRFRELSAADIERYLQRESALDCAGGFKAEGLGVALMESIESLDPTALVGLPLIWLSGALRRAGYDQP